MAIFFYIINILSYVSGLFLCVLTFIEYVNNIPLSLPKLILLIFIMIHNVTTTIKINTTSKFSNKISKKNKLYNFTDFRKLNHYRVRGGNNDYCS